MKKYTAILEKAARLEAVNVPTQYVGTWKR